MGFESYSLFATKSIKTVNTYKHCNNLFQVKSVPLYVWDPEDSLSEVISV